MSDTTSHRPNWLSNISSFLLAMVVLLVLFTLLFDWNWLRKPVSELVKSRTGRELVIAGDLSVHLGKTASIEMENITFGNASWGSADHLLKAKQIAVDIRLWPLLRGQVIMPVLELNEADIALERNAQDQRNWILQMAPTDPGKAPQIGQLQLHQTTIHYVDAIALTDATAKVSTTDDTKMPTHIELSGQQNKVAIGGSLDAGPVLNLQDTRQSFPLRADVQLGVTHLQLDGQFTDILSLAQIDAQLAIAGPDLARLYPLVPVVLPNTPAYAFKGRFVRNDTQYEYQDFAGKIGQSDIKGNALYTDVAPRPHLKAKLQSDLLDLADLGPLIGLSPAQRRPPRSFKQAADEPASEKADEPVTTQDISASSQRVLPASPFKLDKLNAMDADVTLFAKQIHRPDAVPLDSFSTHLNLNDGVLELTPLNFDFAGGQLIATIRMNAQKSPFQTTAKVTLNRVRLRELFPTIPRMDTSKGLLGGVIDLKTQGNSIANMLGNANGEASFAMTGGEMSGLLLEAVDLDGSGIVKYLVGGDNNVPLRCAVAAFAVKEGHAMTDSLVFDTDITRINGRGEINFKNETFNLRINPQPKQFSLFVARTPLRVYGSFAAPEYALVKTPLFLRGAASLGLSLINPLAALIPLVETGSGQDVNCAALLGQAQSASKAATHPAPVTQDINKSKQ
ncbi:AsmA family protein [Ampullimonas aquatilis]|uniref:AsmA family protein n=1 Tax=Ampullimonas aquatilis TaxID=1341549 RepID=UPI003C71A17E